MGFQKLSGRKKSTYVLEQILDEIKGDGYKVGEKLPSEEELAELTGVSRTSVREALAALRLTGVVKSEAGKGTYIKRKPSITDNRLENQALSILKDNASPAEMFEARSTIEEPITDLALDRMGDSDFEKLKGLLEGMREATEAGDFERFLSLNRKFHLTIAEATGNTAIVGIMESVLSYMEEDLWREERRCYYENKEGLLDESFQIHEGIFNAIKDRDRVAVSGEINNHFDRLKSGP